MGKTIPTTFTTGPKDDVAVVDVYKATEAKPTNTIVESITSTVKDAIAQVQGGVSTTLDEANVLSLAKKLQSGELTKDEALKKINDATSGALAKLQSLSTLKDPIVTDLLKSVGFSDKHADIIKGGLGLPGAVDPAKALLDENPKFKVLYGVAGEIKSKGNPTTAAGALELLKTVTGNSEVANITHLGDEFAMLGTAMAKLSELRLPELYDSIVAKIDGAEEKKRFLLSMARQLAEHGDVAGLTKVMDGGVTAGAILHEVPNIIALLLANYRLPTGVSKPTMVEYNALINLVVRISTHWNQGLRNGNWFPDLEVYQQVSSDGKRVLTLNPIHAVLIHYAPLFPKRPVLELLKGFYPHAAIG